MSDELTREGKAQRVAEEFVRTCLSLCGASGPWMQKDVSVAQKTKTACTYEFKVIVHPGQEIEATCEVSRKDWPDSEWAFGDVRIFAATPAANGQDEEPDYHAFKFKTWLTANGIYVHAYFKFISEGAITSCNPDGSPKTHIYRIRQDTQSGLGLYPPTAQLTGEGASLKEAVGDMVLKYGELLGLVINQR